jgi:membrane protease YdiL (CAAX protease family)
VGAATNGVAVVALLVVHNLLTNLWAKDRWYVPANLATAGVLVALGGRVPVVGRPLDGIAAALMVLAAVGLVAVAPAARPVLADRRMEGVDARGTAWRALVRIPLGTVVIEEVAFRGVLPTLVSPLASCALFGLWHVLPAARTLEVNGLRRSAAALLGVVAVTAMVGGALWELRQATGGVLAPALVHVAANSGATAAAYWALRAP